MKLKTKIQLFSTLFMLVLILLVNTSIYFLFYHIAATSELEQLSNEADLLAQELADSSATDVSGLLNAYLPTNGMIRIVGEGEEVWTVQTRNSDYLSQPGSYSTTESSSILPQEDGADIAYVTKPIIWSSGENTGEVASLQVSNHLEPLSDTMTTLFYVLSIASAIMLLPVAIAGTVLSRFLLQPITQLTKAMRINIDRSEWEKISVDNRSNDELHEMEKTFNEMIDYLKDNFEKQEIFVSDASHELKTPISIIKSYSQLLKRRGTENPALVDESLEAIDSEAERMKKLVEQMLALAKNKQSANMQELNITTLAEETTNTFRRAYSRPIQLEKNTEELLVVGDTDQLEQVLYILIDNALKYSNEKIQVLVSKEDGEAVIVVRDYGNGIPKEDQERIFDRFYRMDKARSRDSGGTGLGLAIARSIALEHGGELTVESVEGEGASFYLRLPLLK
ncbi:ATP-binding protein [Virgibacillus xinjiangensis]|uniref:histidine kinase n=1 Tax=Virgibacillus xinjiangensis TaxID=393090 RepID=A0ABV7CSP8_9BACI